MGETRIAIPQKKIADFCRQWQITELSLFGSAIRDDFGPESDIDVLVRFAPDVTWSLLDLARMQDELSRILDRQVDLVERAAVEKGENYIRRRHILRSLETLYVA